MSKFNTTATRPATGQSPIVTDTEPTGVTGQGGAGYARDAKSELFLLAVSNMVGETTFYETAYQRDNRFGQLVSEVTSIDPGWMTDFLRWLRNDGNMRSASLVGALEAARALLAVEKPGARQIVASVLQRADEPGEALAYWTSHYGRSIPKPIKRGIADAATRLYAPYATLKYDTPSHGFRFADVLELTHPSPVNDGQAALFRDILARRHNRAEELPMTPMLGLNATVRRYAEADPAWMLTNGGQLAEAGMTWEDVLSLAGSKVDKALLWWQIIPTMGYMALLRNLRNFDEAGVPDDVAETVAARLADPVQVANSRQFPFRFLSAFKSVSNLRWAFPLEKALNNSLNNIPHLPGKTLILIDRSPSMFPQWSHLHSSAVLDQVSRTGITLADRAALFGVALAARCTNRTVVEYGAASREVHVPVGASVLPMLEKFTMVDGTDTFAAMRQHYQDHDRVVVLTDEQTRAGVDPVPPTVPVYTWNLAGYKMGHLPGTRNRHTFGGLTDQAFRMVQLLESGRGAWPWEPPF